MSCVDVMYQSGLSSCFPGSFTGSSYASAGGGMPYHQNAVMPTGTTSSKMTTGESALKKFGSSRIYADRYGNSSISSSSRLSDAVTPAGGSSCSVTSSHGMSATSTHSRVGLCITDAGRSAGSNHRSGKETGAIEEEKPPIVQYTTPTAYLLIHHSGDASTAVEDHFSRALNPSVYAKSPLPMTSRNLPPSFYDPSIAQAPPVHQSHNVNYGLPYPGYPSTSSDYGYSDSYYPSSFHPASFQHAPADPWQYAYNSVAAQSRAAAAMQMTADFTAANRFNSSSYNSLMSQGLFPATPTIRSSRMDLSGPCKSGANWSAHSVFGTEVPHYPAPAEYDHPFGGKTQSAKDLYWH